MINAMRANSHAEFIHLGADRVDSEQRRCEVSECRLRSLIHGSASTVHAQKGSVEIC